MSQKPLIIILHIFDDGILTMECQQCDTLKFEMLKIGRDICFFFFGEYLL